MAFLSCCSRPASVSICRSRCVSDTCIFDVMLPSLYFFNVFSRSVVAAARTRKHERRSDDGPRARVSSQNLNAAELILLKTRGIHKRIEQMKRADNLSLNLGTLLAPTTETSLGRRGECSSRSSGTRHRRLLTRILVTGLGCRATVCMFVHSRSFVL